MNETISASVGVGGSNREQDVSIVQMLLNFVRRDRGVPRDQLDVDGVLGPKTLAAIKEFQKRFCRVVDGRVEPNHETLTQLNSMAGHFQALNDGSSYLTPRLKPIRYS